MFVLGIDPGLSRCGYGTVSRNGAKFCAHSAGVITTPIDMDLPDRLAMLAGELRSVVAEAEPDVVVVEKVFFQTNARTAMSVGQASGLALVCAIEAGARVAQYTANEVKLSITGYGAAGKEQVARMVAAMLNLDAPPNPPDVADALALAICHLSMDRFHSRIDHATRKSVALKSRAV